MMTQAKSERRTGAKSVGIQGQTNTYRTDFSMPAQSPSPVLPVLVIDTNEPKPSPWEQYFTLSTYRAGLPLGDYSLAGSHDLVSIERKTVDDLIGCLCGSRKRFTRELQAAGRIKDFCVIVEGRYGDILGGRYYSDMTPQSAWGSIIALQERYRIPFYFAESAEIAARLAESILLRWFQEHQKAVETCMKAARGITAPIERQGHGCKMEDPF